MMRHDETMLWQYAARELDSEDARVVQHHLTECPDCQERLADVRTAQGALKAARASMPTLDYSEVDETIGAVLALRSARAHGKRRWYVAAGGLVAVGAALMAFGWYQQRAGSHREVEPVAAVAAAPPAKVTTTASATVEQANGLTRVGAEQQRVEPGAPLHSGDVLKTAAGGQGLMRLSDGSRLKLNADSQLALTRVAADEVALHLERGTVLVGASHARRKGFVIHSQGLMVHVVGTTFSVATAPGGIEVAVAEGRVAVEPPGTLPVFVNAGQKARFDTQRWRMRRERLPTRAKAELMRVAASVEPAPLAVAPVPASGGARHEPPPAIANTAAKSEPQARAVEPGRTPAVAATVPTAPAADSRAPAASSPESEPLPVPLLASPVESVQAAATATNEPEPSSAPEEWAAMPAPAAAPAALPVAPAPNASRPAEALPDDVEGIFLMRAERALTRGTCQRYLLGLDELAADAKRGERAERARVLRARCFDASMKPNEASGEYRKYLERYPDGRFAEEARQILSDQ